MQFVNPLFLLGLLAVSVPVIIHLFNFRRFRKVYFTNVRYLRELKQETRKQSQLRHLIILALRILAVISLVMAFAQPYIPIDKSRKPQAAGNTVSVFVDNSFSMEATGSNGTLFDEARQKAREIVAAYKPSDRFQLLTNDFEGRHQRLVTRDEFLIMLNEIKVTSSVRKLSEITMRQADLLATQALTNRNAYIISDFQKSVFNETGIAPQEGISTWLVPLKASSPGNVYIDSCWFDLPLQQAGQTAQMNVRVVNRSGIALEKVPLKLKINGNQKGVAGVDLASGAITEVKIPFTNYEPGIQYGEIEVADYPVVYDDKFYFSYEVTSSIQVLSINGKESNRYLDALFSGDSSVFMQNAAEKSIDFSKLPLYNLVILNEPEEISSGLAQEMKRYLDNGGTVMFIPSSGGNGERYNSFLSSVACPLYGAQDTAVTRVVKLNLDDPVFRNVFEKTPASGDGLPPNTELPKVRKHLSILPSGTSLTRPLIVMVNGKPMLSVTSSGKGQVYQFAVPFNPAFSSFQQQALFVPVLYNIALMSRPPLSLCQVIGQNTPVSVQGRQAGEDDVYRIKVVGGEREFIPEHRREGQVMNIFVNGQVTEAGNYSILMKDREVAGLAFNYNRNESDPECLDKGGIEEVIDENKLSGFTILEAKQQPLDRVISQMSFGIRLWKYFIWAALLFLLAEVLLIRLWKD